MGQARAVGLHYTLPALAGRPCNCHIRILLYRRLRCPGAGRRRMAREFFAVDLQQITAKTAAGRRAGAKDGGRCGRQWRRWRNCGAGETAAFADAQSRSPDLELIKQAKQVGGQPHRRKWRLGSVNVCGRYEAICDRLARAQLAHPRLSVRLPEGAGAHRTKSMSQRPTRRARTKRCRVGRCRIASGDAGSHIPRTCAVAGATVMWSNPSQQEPSDGGRTAP